ncbi:hypothetical protein J5N97_019351 [Dioscorea zingiberensis]|uniref:Dof zinc finger protein n=1 Tax=Dioscorea zingiberensis TaxID=325984 RepID=A0A9D5CDP4_9LILI|nr:hypothetical protein J5N97_019351 [Dioscorea zingiberensis]
MQNSTALSSSQQQEQQQIKCPRCDSTNTKFSYYNNYNLSQPRHYCKSCRRYWTLGGTLRDVPIGGGSRKSSKRSPCTTNSKNSLTSSPEPLELGLITDPVIDQDERMLDINESFTSLLSSGGHFAEILDGFSIPNSNSLAEFDSNVFGLPNSSDNGGANEKTLQQESLLGLHGWWMS